MRPFIDRHGSRTRSVSRVPRRLTARGERRRQQLTDFAAHQFATQGYHPTSVTDIVDGLGVGKGVFYWYFSSKEELFRQILADAQRDLRRAQRQAVADEPDPVRRIEAGIARLGHLARRQPPPLRPPRVRPDRGDASPLSSARARNRRWPTPCPT